MQRLLLALAAAATFGLAQAQAQGVSEGAPAGAPPEAPAQAQAAPAQPTGDPQRGKALFVADGCYQCHGYVGQGSIRTGRGFNAVRQTLVGIRYWAVSR